MTPRLARRAHRNGARSRPSAARLPNSVKTIGSPCRRNIASNSWIVRTTTRCNSFEVPAAAVWYTHADEAGQHPPGFAEAVLHVRRRVRVSPLDVAPQPVKYFVHRCVGGDADLHPIDKAAVAFGSQRRHCLWVADHGEGVKHVVVDERSHCRPCAALG